jgi:hypothetical protein
MKKLLLLLIVLFIHGCAGIAPGSKGTVLLHEASESRLLTEAEFMARASQSADQIYEGMSAINDAVSLYAIENNGDFPMDSDKKVRSLLLDGGYLTSWPDVPPFAFTDPITTDVRYKSQFDDMDGAGERDSVISVRDLKSEVCEVFARRYSDPYFKGSIYDYKANGDRYPKGLTGKDVRIFAIRWEGGALEDYCDVLWVVQYNN